MTTVDARMQRASQDERPACGVLVAAALLAALLSVDLGPYRYPQLEPSRFVVFLAIGICGAWFARTTSLSERTLAERLLLAAFGWSAAVSLLTFDPFGAVVVGGARFGTLVLGMQLGRALDRARLWPALAVGTTVVLGVGAVLGTPPDDTRWIGLSEEPNGLAVTAALTVVASIISTRRHRVAWIGVLAGAITLFATNAAIPALAAAVGVLVWLTRLVNPIARRALTAAGLILAASIAIAVVVLPTEALPGDGYNLETMNERTGIWSYLAERVPEAPFLGHGPTASHDLAALGVFDERVHWGPNHAHSAPLEMAVTGGLPAAALFVVGLVLAICSALRRSDASTAAVAITLAILAITEPLVRDPSLALLLLGMVAVAGPSRESSTTASDDTVSGRFGVAPSNELRRSDDTEK